MPYSRRMSTRYPGCLIVLIDQSASMAQPIAGNPGLSRAAALAQAVDLLLDELVDRCVKDESLPVMPWCDVAVLGYGGHGVRSMLAGDGFVSTAKLDELGAPTGADATGPRLQATRRWITPLADGNTPMAEAVARAHDLAARWIGGHPDSFPPVVLNITDGQANTGDPAAHAARLTALGTRDGGVLLFNLHLSGDTSAMVEFPSAPPQLGDPFATHLFGMSSVIPDPMVETSQFPLSPGARGFVFNGGATSLTRFFMWGTPFAAAGP